MYMRWGFPNDSMVKESTCKAGDTGDVGELILALPFRVEDEDVRLLEVLIRICNGRS